MEKWRKGGELLHHQEQQMFSEQRKGKLSEKQNSNFNNHKSHSLGFKGKSWLEHNYAGLS